MAIKETTGNTLNRSAAKGFDRAAFRFRQAVDGLARTIYYAILQAANEQTPAFEAAGSDIRAYCLTEAERRVLEGLALLARLKVMEQPPAQPVVMFCTARDYKVTRYPRDLMGGKVLAKLEPNQRPS